MHVRHLQLRSASEEILAVVLAANALGSSIVGVMSCHAFGDVPHVHLTSPTPALRRLRQVESATMLPFPSIEFLLPQAFDYYELATTLY
jgi:hypothetical protein